MQNQLLWFDQTAVGLFEKISNEVVTERYCIMYQKGYILAR